MHNLYDYKKFAILYVDDEEKSLKYFHRAFDDTFRILTATNAAEGFRLLQEHKDDIGILMTDQRMPGEKGVQLLEKARQLRPRVIRVLATAYSDLEAAIDAVNTGAIYKYVTKPWDVPQLEATLKRGMEFFIVQRERDQLLREKLSVLHNMMITDRVVSLGVVAAGLGHYVRNSLVAVRTFLDLAPSRLQDENVDLDELRNPNFWQDFYTHVQNQVMRISELLANLGAAADKHAPALLDEVEVDKIVAEAVAKSQESLSARNIAVENQIPASLPSLKVDRPKFQRLFELVLKDELINLPPGSRVSFNAELTPYNDDKQGALQIRIRDNGPGLPQEALRSVFDPFFVRTDKPQEFGINLMACYFIVYHHGGKIDVQSEEGAGTTFILTFPLDPQPRTRTQEDKDFVAKVLMNEALWEKLLSGV